MDDARAKQVQRDEYYMSIAGAVEKGANCLGTPVGALLVVDDRVIGSGFNGTPSSFPNCREGGCLRCRDRWLEKQGRGTEMSDPEHTSGKALDRCICVHAEQNAFITAARFGIRVEGATLYTTQSPCFGCLKEAVQAGVRRIVYQSWYHAHYGDALQRLYWDLADHLSAGEPTNFEALGGRDAPKDEEGQPDPYAEETATTLEPPKSAL
jgi:dCMP deaminase